MNFRSCVQVVFLGLWFVAVAASYVFLLNYKGIPGSSGSTPEVWPRESMLNPEPNRPTLIMVAHPRCPCTVAGLDALADLLSHFPKRVGAHVLFVQPEGVRAGWEKDNLWHQAEAIPDVTVSADPLGREAKRFGAATSGHVLVYHPDGRLLLSGGITAARGHAGASLGLDRLFALFQGAETAPSSLPVFGCPLQGPCPACVKETK
jgi:hypothetical protein